MPCLVQPNINEGEDLSEYVQELVDQAPVNSDRSFCSIGSYSISLPSGRYAWDNEIVVPGNKDICILGDCLRSTIIENTGNTPYIINAQGSAGAGHNFHLSGVSSIAGAVRVGQRRGDTTIEKSKFINTEAPAIDFYGETNNFGVVNFNVNQVETSFCLKGVSLAAKSSVISSIRHSRFIACTLESVFADGIGLRIDRSDFQAAGGEAFVIFSGEIERSSLNGVTNSRFGAEDVLNGKTGLVVDRPDYDVVVGPSTLAPAALRFRDNDHIGRENITKAGALSAFKFYDRPLQVQITGSYFAGSYQNALVEEGSTAGAQQNLWADNMQPVVNSNPIFSGSGTGWQVR